jgi:5'-nucleotidase / UDP-sugar diphosphatase
MKRGKKLSALFLALVMAFSLAIPAGAANWDEDLTGHIVILHTNDVHGAIDNYASVAALKDAYEAAGAQVLLMDAGDFSQGSTSVNVSEGATAVELMNMAGYDVATTGNHEFDFGYANLKTLMESAEFPILAADAFTAEGDLAMDGDNLTFQLGDVTVGVFGLATPETATKAHPAKLEGVTFLAEDELFNCAQEQVDELTAEGCDYIICLGHLGIDAESTGNRSIDLLENVTGIDVFIDGHSHSEQSDIAEVTDGTGMVGDTILTSTGTKLENIGVVDIAADGTIDATTIPMEDVTATEGFTPDQAIADRVAEINAQIEEEMGVVIGTSEVNLNGVKEEVRAGETNLGDLVTDAMLWQAGLDNEAVDAAITNGGGIRASISAGDITKQFVNDVLPFGNTLYVIELTGAELLEALEASTFVTPEPEGGFPQVAGMEFVVNTGADFDAGELYPGTTFHEPNSINRVSILTVGGDAFDVNATYTIVTNDFMAAGGDTYYAFSAAGSGYDTGVPLDQVVMDYIAEELNGTVTAADYGEPAGRIHTISYNDVTAGDWFTPDVIYVTLTGLMNGTGDGFSPNNNINRAQLVTVLYRMAGQPEVTGENPFTDVPDGQWYTDAVLWAAENNITDGTSETTFSPNNPLTREQMATFFYRFANFEAGEPIEVTGDLSGYTDADLVADYAVDAMTWAVGEGVISGIGNNTLAPDNTASRAQMATVLTRYTAE